MTHQEIMRLAAAFQLGLGGDDAVALVTDSAMRWREIHHDAHKRWQVMFATREAFAKKDRFGIQVIS